MKIVFMGTPDFAAVILEALVRESAEIEAVVTQPDKPVGRKAELRPTAVKTVALEAGIPVLQPRRVREPEAIEAIRALQPDLIVVAAFGQIIPGEILRIPPLGCVNIHGSLLPKYRGAAPIQWALLDGETETGITLMQMDEGLDTGAMLATRVVPITPEETGGSLFDKMAEAGAQLLLEHLEDLAEGRLQAQPQPEESPTPYARMIKKEDGRIDWHRSAVEIERQIRALDPWPSAYTLLEGKTCKIWKAAVAQATTTEKYDTIAAVPGSILKAEGEDLLIRTGEGILAVTEIQPEGKKRMHTGDFLRGRSVSPGTILE